MAAKPQPVRQVLWYTRPATNWMTEALPVGNGRIGAMIFGGLPVERIQFNDKTLWTGSTTERGAYQNFGDIFIDFGAAGGNNPRVLSITAGSWILTMRWPRSFIRRMA